MTRTQRIAAVVVTLLVALWLGAGWYGSSMVMRPPWYAGTSPDGRLPVVDNDSWGGAVLDPEAEFGIAFEDVEFPAEDGQTLRGWFVPRVGGASATGTSAPGAISIVMFPPARPLDVGLFEIPTTEDHDSQDQRADGVPESIDRREPNLVP